jgi:hypothetical protein
VSAWCDRSARAHPDELGGSRQVSAQGKGRLRQVAGHRALTDARAQPGDGACSLASTIGDELGQETVEVAEVVVEQPGRDLGLTERDGDAAPADCRSGIGFTRRGQLPV